MSKLIDASKTIQGKSTSKSPVSLQKKRLNICNSCTDENGKPMKIKITGQCRDCWCILSDKVKYIDEKCRLGKW